MCVCMCQCIIPRIPRPGDTFPNVGAECGAGVAGIVGALGEVAASATLAMTSCKEFPMAGALGWDGMMILNGEICKYAMIYIYVCVCVF